MKTAFYGVSVLLNGAWVKKVVIGVPIDDLHDAMERILKALRRLREFVACPWEESKVHRLNPKDTMELLEWRETVRGRFMAVQLESLEDAVHVLFGLSA